MIGVEVREANAGRARRNVGKNYGASVCYSIAPSVIVCGLIVACGGSSTPTAQNLPNTATTPVAAIGGNGGALAPQAGGAGAGLASAGSAVHVAAGSGASVLTTGAGGSAAATSAGGALPPTAAGAAGVVSAAAGAGGNPAALATGSNTAPGFVNLAPTQGEALDGQGTTSSPAPPAGWVWYAIDGAVCRDGSPTGFYVRLGAADKLLIYLEGGGACTSPGFCTYNPANINQVLNGDGQTVAGSIGGAVSGHQQPGTDGIFNITEAANPFKDWNQIYVPYCTGDVHFGTHANATISGVNGSLQFVGYLNMKKFISRIVPTFQSKVSRVVLTGASAGGFGALLNYSMVQDAFGSVLVTVLDDSGPSFADDPTAMPVCMQKRWRDLWGFKDSFPPDCTECQQVDGGGLNLFAKFLARKHPNATIGVVSSMQDEVIRLFYSSGLQNCANFDTADPTTITLGQADSTVYLTGDAYTNGLNKLRSDNVSTGRLATYYLGGSNITFHQHIWRARFYDASAGTETIAAWTTNLLAGKLEQIGP